MKKTIMIFGVSSFVGSNLVEILKDEYRIIGTYFKTPVTVTGVTTIQCDVLKKDYVSSLIGRFRPDFTIYAVGLSSLKECELFPKQADALNSAGAVNCCTAAERFDSRFILISSCYVLAGENIIYREAETPFPNTVYGNTLSSTEFYVQRSCLNYLILRCGPLYGRGYNPTHGTWFEYLQASLAKGESIMADDTVHTGFLDIQIMVKLLKELIEKDVSNRLFHISSKNYMTRYEFGRSYAKAFRKDESLVQKTAGIFPIDKNSEKDENSTYYYQLDNTNIEEFLGVQMPTIEESLHLTYKRFSSQI